MARIYNITADGNFNKLDLPGTYGSLKFQARTAVDIQVRYPGQTDFWTIKSGDNSGDFPGQFGAQGLEVKAANGTVIEVILGGG